MVRFHFASHFLAQYDLPLCVTEQQGEISTFKLLDYRDMKHVYVTISTHTHREVE